MIVGPRHTAETASSAPESGRFGHWRHGARRFGSAGGVRGPRGRAESRDGQPPAVSVIAAAASSGLTAPANSSAVWSLIAPPTSGVKNWSRYCCRNVSSESPSNTASWFGSVTTSAAFAVRRQRLVDPDLALHVGAHDVAEELDRLRRGVFADDEAVDAAEPFGGHADATVDRREREPIRGSTAGRLHCRG